MGLMNIPATIPKRPFYNGNDPHVELQGQFRRRKKARSLVPRDENWLGTSLRQMTGTGHPRTTDAPYRDSGTARGP